MPRASAGHEAPVRADAVDPAQVDDRTRLRCVHPPWRAPSRTNPSPTGSAAIRDTSSAAVRRLRARTHDRVLPRARATTPTAGAFVSTRIARGWHATPRAL